MYQSRLSYTWARFIGLTGCAIALTAATTAAQAASFAFEAESANQITSPFTVKSDANASGGKFVVQPLHTGRPPAVKCLALYKVHVTTAGQYHVWGRTYWPHGCGNSVNVAMGNGDVHTLGQDGTYNRWHWVELKGVTYNLKPGTYEFKMLNREDGPEVDEFFFTTDEDYVPMGAVRQTANVISK